MKRTLAIILAAIMLLSLASVFVSAEGEVKTAKAAYGTPTIDGKIDACWNNAEVNKFDTDTKTDSKDVVGQFRVMWDETYIYFLYEIKDSTMMDEATTRKDTNWYARDQVAIAINPTNDYTATTGVGKTTNHFWYTYRPYGVVPNFCQAPAGTFLSELEGFDISKATDFTLYPMSTRMYAYDITSDGYVIEAKVNITARYADWKNAAGKTLAFDTFVYGNDYTAADTAAVQDHIYPWADRSVTSYKDNSKKGQILFVEKSAAPETGDNFGLFAVIALVAVLGTAIVVKKVND